MDDFRGKRVKRHMEIEIDDTYNHIAKYKNDKTIFYLTQNRHDSTFTTNPIISCLHGFSATIKKFRNQTVMNLLDMLELLI